MSIGIMGGTFNPIHMGHLIVSEYIREDMELDLICFIPTGNPPHKVGEYILDGQKRYELVKKAINDNEKFVVSDIEVTRMGYSYSIDTIRHIMSLYPEDKLYFIIGSDKLFELPTWKEVDKLIQLVEFVVYDRGYYSEEEINSQISMLFQNGYLISRVKGPKIDISSSMIRERIKSERSIKYLCPKEVEETIESELLYKEDKNGIY